MAQRINVALGFSPDTNSQLTAVSAELSKFGSVIKLGPFAAPHASLYATWYTDNKIDDLQRTVKNLVASCPPSCVDCHQLVAMESRYIGICFEATDLLKTFQQRVLEALSPLRDKVPALPGDGEENLDRSRQESVRTWGSPWAVPWIPHVTVARLPEEHTAGPAVRYVTERFCPLHSLLIDRILVGRTGQNGVLEEVLSTYWLSE